MLPQVYCSSCRKAMPADATTCPSCGVVVDDIATRRLETPKSARPLTPGADRRPSPPSPGPSSPPHTISFDNLDGGRFLPGAIVAERYRIIGLLGKGGMGEVYRADDLKLGQAVALKFLPLSFLTDGAALARFHREVRVARQVSHRNVCRVYDIGEVEGHHFLSMEFIKGEELSSLLRRIGRLPSDKAVQIARQICAGLAAAHEGGVLHRDLKPSNIMIDGEGNARITDFGLAGLAEDIRDDEIGAGTPAYMAPEQLEGKGVTVRSDIYSLGVVFYELFTGKRAFEAATLNELIQLRLGDSTPTIPSSIVKDLDPAVERLIDRCLARDPAARPSSALQVAAALPGGDPLTAALAAGETPSPEMVAAVKKSGTLQPAIAISLLASVLVFIGAAMLLSKQVGLHRIIPLPKPPEVLKENAIQITKAAGYVESPADSMHGFNVDTEYYLQLARQPGEFNPWQTLRHAQPALIHFWYRQSPTSLIAYSSEDITMDDPPNETSGMVLVSTDTEGKLRYFEAVPEQRSVDAGTGGSGEAGTGGSGEGATGNSEKAQQQYEFLFRSAGLDISSFQPVTSEWTPPRAFDTRQAWTGVYPKIPTMPIRVEAATFQGKPVYFQIINPWTRPNFELSADVLGSKVFLWTLLTLFFAMILVAALLAVRNLRMGRGDRRGAFRLALVLFLIRMTDWLFGTHHLASTDEQVMLITGLQSALFWGCFVGLIYLALEPYLRRRWPQRIISWSRLIAGDWRDPMVGRDLLIGATFGAFAVMLMYLRTAVLMWLGFYPGMPDVIDGFATSMVGIGPFVRLFVTQISASVVQSFMIVFLLLFLSQLLRSDWLGIGVGSVIIGLLFLSMTIGTNHPLGVSFVMVAGAIFVFCAVRFGPLALMTCLAFFHLWVFFPITTELNAWYATVFVVDLVILLALAVYGFYTSLGGQPLLQNREP